MTNFLSQSYDMEPSYDFGISVGSNINSVDNYFHNEKSTPEVDGFLASDAVLYSMISELNQSLPNYSTASHLSSFPTDLELIDALIPTPELLDPVVGNVVAWTENSSNHQHQINQAPLPAAQQHQMTTTSQVSPKNNEIEMSCEQSFENVPKIGLVSASSSSPAEATEEEDPSIRLVHLLMTCAESVQHGHISLAAALIEEMRFVLTRVNTLCGIGKVAGPFIDALARRVFSPQERFLPETDSTQENEFLYHHFYEACPFLKFAHFTANQAILEAFEGHDYVHLIDFNLVHGLQWPSLIQALALRPGGPPFLRLTGIGPPSTDGSDSLREIGLRLAEVAWSVNVKFTFRGVAASRLDDVKPWMLQVKPMEAVAVNSIMQLHRLLATDPIRGSPIDTVLSWIRSLNPKIVTVVEQEADHNQPGFLTRFTEALYYYSTIFDSLDACGLQQEKAFAEMYIQKEICNVLSCEGISRVERHEPLIKWRNRLVEAGFGPLHLGSNALKQARMLLTLFSAEGYSVEENDGFLTLNWQSRPLIAASAWQPFASN
ncbi:hypothetical protein MKX01_002165 [Papaver californicum]|nr:hypothetical protein MKX01_002165 [Papaver californicum]